MGNPENKPQEAAAEQGKGERAEAREARKPETLDELFDRALPESREAAGQIQEGAAQIEAKAAAQGAALTPKESAENKAIAAEAQQTAAAERQALEAKRAERIKAMAERVDAAMAKEDMEAAAKASAEGLAAQEWGAESGKKTGVQSGPEVKVVSGVSEIKPAAPEKPAEPKVIVDETVLPGVEYFDAKGNKIDKAAEAAKEAQQAKEKEAQEKAAKEQAEIMTRKQAALDEAGAKWADLEAQLKKFEGLGAARLLTSSGRTERTLLQAELAKAQEKYQELRGEVVGENVDKYLNEREKLVEVRRAALEKEKGLGTKIYEAYKKLGELNLTKLGWKPTSRLGRIAARALSVRTAISLGLAGAGFAFGATPAVGVAAIFGRRVLAGIGSSVGSYDLMRMRADRKAEKFTPDELSKMSPRDVTERLEKIEAQAMTGGKALAGNEAYKQLQAKFGELLGGRKGEIAEGAAERSRADLVMNKLNEQMLDADRSFEAMKAKRARNDKIMKGAALAIGVFVGSGMLAKGVQSLRDYAGIGRVAPTLEGARGAVSGAAVEAAPQPQGVGVAAETAPQPHSVSVAPDGTMAVETPKLPVVDQYNPKMLAAAEIHQGDGYTKVISRQLEADPQKWGYDPKVDGDVHRWAARMSTKIARDNDLLSARSEMRLQFNPKSPGHVFLERSGDRFLVHKEPGVLDRAFVRPSVTEMGQGIEGGGDWKVKFGYSESGVPNSYEIGQTRLPDASVSKEYLLQHSELAKHLDAGRNIDSLLAGERGEQYGKWLGRLYEEQRTLDKLKAMGYGNSPAAHALEKSLEKKFAIVERFSASEPVKIEVPKGLSEVSPAEGEPAPADVAEFKSVDQYQQVFETRHVPKAELEKLLHAPPEGQVTLTDAEGHQFTVDADDIHARAAASRELNLLKGQGAPSAEVVKGAVELKGVYTPNQVKLGDSWVGRGATADSLRALADHPARAGEMLELKTADGQIIKVAGGFDAKRAARLALERMGQGGGVDTAQETVVPPVHEAAHEAVPVGKVVEKAAVATELKGVYTPNQVKLGDSWVGRGATADSLRALADHPARAGEMLELRTADGQVIKVAGGFDAKRAARLALERMGQGGGTAVEQPVAGGGAASEVHEAAHVTETPKPPKVEVNPVAGGHELVSFEGGNAGFRYDAGGNVTGIQVEATMGPQDAAKVSAMFNDGWIQTAAEHSKMNPSLAQSVVEARTRDIYLDQKALDAMSAGGKGASPEADFLRKHIASQVQNLEKRFGDVLK